MNDTQTQIERLIELAIVQRTELKQLVEQLPQLREHLNAEIERNLEEIEPQLRSELEEFCDKRAVDANAKVGSALEAKIIELSKALEMTTQARFNAIKEQERKVEELRQLAAKQIKGHVATLPEAVKEIVGAELARFPRAGEIDQLRKEFAEPKGLNPRGKWLPSETYNRLDLVTYNGDSFTSAIDGNRSRPSRNAAEWTLIAARGTGGGGPTSLSELTTVPSNGDLLIGSGTSWVTSNLTAGAGISITVGAGEITISATDGDITLDDGTAASPSLHFTNDPDTGIYRPAANTLGISVSGTQVAYFDENGLTVPSAGVVAGGSFHGANGNANNPSHSFTSDQDTGFYRHASNQIGVSTSGTASLIFTNNAGELLGHTGVSVTFGAGSSGATLALGQGTNGGVTITPKGSGTAVIAGTTIPASKTLVVTTDKLSALAATTSSELAGVISDETGTGALVFANTPTLVTPNIGAATGTSVNLSGAGTFGGNLTVSGTGESTFSGTIVPAANITKNFGKTTAAWLAVYAKYLQQNDASGYLTSNTDGSIALNSQSNQNITLTPHGTGASVISKNESNTNAITTALNYIKIQNTNLGGTYIGALEFYTWDNRRAAGIFANRNNIDGTSGVLSFAYSTSGNSFAEGFRLNSTGNLLVGTTTDGGQKLQVSGTAYVSGNATFAGSVTATTSSASGVESGFSNTAVNTAAYSLFSIKTASGGGDPYLLFYNVGVEAWSMGMDVSDSNSWKLSRSTSVGSNDRLTITTAGDATFAGSIAINNTVQTAAAVASTHKVTISIGGVTYYLLATNV